MDTIRKALAVMLKDLRVVSQDRAYLISMLIFPMLITFLNASIFGGTSESINLPVALVNQDSGAYGAALAEVMNNIPELDLAKLDSPTAANQAVTSGNSLAAVVVPLDFSQRIDAYQPGQVTVILDPAQAQYGRIISSIVDEVAGGLAIQGEIRYGISQVLASTGLDETANPALRQAAQAQTEGVIFTQISRMGVDDPIQVNKDVIKGRQVFTWDSLFDLMLPALTVMFAFFITAAVSTDLLKEREAGSLRRLVAAPLPRSALIGGKVLAYTLIVLIQVALVFGLAVVVADMSLGSSPLGLLLTSVCLGLVATTMGMLVAALAKSIEQAGSISLLLIFVLGIFSGAFSPQIAPYRGEGVMATLARLTPQAQATIAYHTLILQNGGVLDILPQLAYLLALSLLFFLIAIWRFKFES